MSRAIVTKAVFDQAVNSLLAEGNKPGDISCMMIRKKAGGGSFTTIGDFLEEWLAECDRQAHSVPMPADLASRMQLAMGDLWTTAMRRALTEVAHELEAIRQLSAEGQRLQEEIDRLDGVLEATEAAKLNNLRRFVGCLDAIRQAVNEGCGGLLEALMTSAPELTAKVKGFQSRVNAECDQARDDQAALLSAFLHKRQLGSPATATPPPDRPVTVAQQLAGLA